MQRREELTPQLLFLFLNYKDNLLSTGILLDEEQTTLKGFELPSELSL